MNTLRLALPATVGKARWIIAADNLRRYVAGERLLSVADLERGF